MSRTRRSSWRSRTTPHGPTFGLPFTGNRVVLGEAVKPPRRDEGRPLPPKFHGMADART